MSATEYAVKNYTSEQVPAVISRDSSAVLKGVGILVVLISHYLSFYIYEDNPVSGVANVTVSVFFILSGYGVFSSLRKRLKNKLGTKAIFIFYKDRLLKIIPLLWISLCLQFLITGNTFPATAFFGYELTGHYWFISSILQCYLLSPFLFLIIEAGKYCSLGSVTLGMMLLASLERDSSVFEPLLMGFHLAESPYLQIYFLHTYLFFCGMCLHHFGYWFEHKRILSKALFCSRRLVFWLLLFAALTYTCLEKAVFSGLPLLGSLCLFFLTCAYALQNHVASESIAIKAVKFIGNHSLPIYLFHMSYYFLLERLGLLSTNPIVGISFTITLLPVFVSVSTLLETFVDFFYKKLQNLGCTT
ncbi:MAG: acyltransferase family protein [Elainellaceae cyanobacterium]